MKETSCSPVAGPHSTILLSSVFGPYAQDDEYGSRALNPMELYHNQVTRVQGPFSLRMFHRSWGLMLIQANIEAPCTLLDFPTLDRFVEEIRNNRYDVVGISGIIPNTLKVRKMCELVRRYQPDATMGGGISDARRVMEACRMGGLCFAPHTWTNGIGLLINLHLYAAGERDHPLEYPYEPPGWTAEARDGLLAEPILADLEGTIAVPESPGLGIELDTDRLARYGEKFFDITTRGIAVKTIREKGFFTALRLARKKRRRG